MCDLSNTPVFAIAEYSMTNSDLIITFKLFNYSGRTIKIDDNLFTRNDSNLYISFMQLRMQEMAESIQDISIPRVPKNYFLEHGCVYTNEFVYWLRHTPYLSDLPIMVQWLRLPHKQDIPHPLYGFFIVNPQISQNQIINDHNDQ